MSLLGRQIGPIRIEALLGRGGMGEVYQGFDTKLERLVAVKTIRTSRRLDERARAWFLREARNLSKLDHPNICRIYDLIQGRDLSDDPGTDMLVLELVEGRTLDDLDPESLSWERRAEIGAGIAAALAAAHERGVIHRDLKPANVMLTDEGEVKVLDFGISRSLDHPSAPPPGAGSESVDVAGAEADRTLTAGWMPGSAGAATPAITAPGSVVGTLRYMSPEQARGEEVTEAADLYSLGVLLQELLTGEAAYATEPGEKPREGTDDLQKRVAAGRTVSPVGLPAPWRSLIEALTDRDPGVRPTAADAAARLAWLVRAPQRRRNRRRWLLAALISMAVLVGAVAATRALSRPKALLEPGETARIALLPFANATGDPSNDWVRIGLRELVAETLGSAREAEILRLEDTVQMVEGLGIDDLGAPSPTVLERLGRALGSDLVIATEVAGGEGAYRLRSTVFDTGGSLGVRTVEAAEPTRGAQALAARLARRLRPEAVILDQGDAFSDDPYVNRTYALGVDALETTGGKAAEPFFRVCLGREERFSRAALRLASALRIQGEWEQSQEQVEAVLRDARETGDRELEIEASSILGTLLVDQGELNAATERYGLTLELSRALGDRSGEADAIRGVGIVHYFRAEYQQARERLQEALEIRRALGDRRGEMRLLSNLGAVADGMNEDETAMAYDLQALEMARTLGDRHSEADFVGNLGVSHLWLGKAEEATSFFRESLALAEQLGDAQAEASAVHNLGLAAQLAQRWDSALEHFADARERFGELGDPAHRARSSMGIAKVHFERGEPLKPILDELDEYVADVEPWFGDTADMLHIKARLAFERGDAGAALKLEEQAVADGEPWDGQGPAALARYRRAARTAS